MDMNVLPSAIRDLSSAPETENSMDCSGELRKVCSIIVRPKRLMEDPVSIKIVMGLLSKLADTRHCRSFKAWFWITLLQLLC